MCPIYEQGKIMGFTVHTILLMTVGVLYLFAAEPISSMASQTTLQIYPCTSQRFYGMVFLILGVCFFLFLLEKSSIKVYFQRLTLIIRILNA